MILLVLSLSKGIIKNMSNMEDLHANTEHGCRERQRMAEICTIEGFHA